MYFVLLLRRGDALIASKIPSLTTHPTTIVSLSMEEASCARDLGFKNVKLIGLPADHSYRNPNSYWDTLLRARELDACFSALRLEKFPEIGCTTGWEYLNFFYVVNAIKGADFVAQALSEFSQHNIPLHYFTFGGRFDYYFDNNWWRDLALSRVGPSCKVAINLDSLSNSRYPDLSSLRPMLPSEETVKRIVHCPTVFYARERSRIASIVGEQINEWYDMQSPFWDVQILEKRIPLADTKRANHADTKVSDYLTEYREILEKYFSEYLEPGQDNPIDRFIERAEFQIESFFILDHHQATQQLESVITPDLECGIVGPLWTLAKKRGAEIYVVPHSGVRVNAIPSFLDGDAREISGNPATDQALFLGPQRLLPRQMSVNSGARLPVEALSVSIAPLGKDFSRCAFIFNAFDDSCDVRYCDPESLVKLANTVLGVLAKFDIDVVVRPKPHLIAQRYLPISGEIHAGSLDELINRCDLAISIGEPTTALLDFHAQSITCFHVHTHRNTYDTDIMLPPDIIEFE
jgi:hypothetical protein